MEDDSNNTFIIRPDYAHKFRPAAAQELIHSVLAEFFVGKEYDTEACLNWCQEVSDLVKDKLKELQLPRYKYVVNTTIGEQRGAGVKVGAKCLWDSDTDQLAQDVYVSDSLYCSVAAYAVYYY
eukprot:m.7442 g.7442  ORF g.7442 m.7442 type:complete len:123 (-) comp8825_c0_seq1:62-430(-)